MELENYLLNFLNASILRGRTKLVEYIEFQKENRPVFMYFTEPHDLVIEKDQYEATWVFVSSIDVDENSAKIEFEQAMYYINNSKADEFLKMHTSRFQKLWQIGRVESDNFEMQTLINSCFYYILSSLPTLDHFGQIGKFYGLSPGTLSRGSMSDDYQGHSFWDTGIYIRPNTHLFYI